LLGRKADCGAESSIERAEAQLRIRRGAGDVVGAIRVDEPSHDVAHVGIGQRGGLDPRCQPLGPHGVEGLVVRRACERPCERQGADAEHLGGGAHQIAHRDGVDAEHLRRGVRPESDATQHQAAAHRYAQRAQAWADHAGGDGRTAVRHDEQRHTAIGPDGVQRGLSRRHRDVERPAGQDMLGERLGRRLLALEEPSGRVRCRHVRKSAG
jgi:hypothetical protein